MCIYLYDLPHFGCIGNWYYCYVKQDSILTLLFIYTYNVILVTLALFYYIIQVDDTQHAPPWHRNPPFANVTVGSAAVGIVIQYNIILCLRLYDIIGIISMCLYCYVYTTLILSMVHITRINWSVI